MALYISCTQHLHITIANINVGIVKRLRIRFTFEDDSRGQVLTGTGVVRATRTAEDNS